MRTIKQHLTYSKVAASLAVFLAAGGAAWAAKGSSGTIHACYAKRGGALRIASHCRPTEKTLGWNQVGATGARGGTGATGGMGAAGSAGGPGPTGPSDI
jgi:hypothetical protein